jgi:molybdenum transport protein
MPRPYIRHRGVSSGEGGASIHRLGLFDSILVFDQHREFTGGSEGFRATVREVGDRFPEKKIVAEAQSPEEALAFVPSLRSPQ